jgi:hypothetical protein
VSETLKLLHFISALSILQNGAFPNFMDENVLQELWHSETPSPSIIKLRQGLNTLGIMEVIFILLLLIDMVYDCLANGIWPFYCPLLINLLE